MKITERNLKRIIRDALSEVLTKEATSFLKPGVATLVPRASPKSTWSGPINLPSLDSLESVRGSTLPAPLKASFVLPVLRQYIEGNYGWTLKDAVDQWLEDNPEYVHDLKSQRVHLLRIGREAGLK